MVFFCSLQLSSDAAVKRVLAGEKADAKGKPPPSKPRDKESREPKAEEQKSHRDKEVAFAFLGGTGVLLFTCLGFF